MVSVGFVPGTGRTGIAWRGICEFPTRPSAVMDNVEREGVSWWRSVSFVSPSSKRLIGTEEINFVPSFLIVRAPARVALLILSNFSIDCPENIHFNVFCLFSYPWQDFFKFLTFIKQRRSNALGYKEQWYCFWPSPRLADFSCLHLQSLLILANYYNL